MSAMGRELIQLGAQIADMKEVDYHNTLAIATLIQLLIDKGIITKDEVTAKARELDALSVEELAKR